MCVQVSFFNSVCPRKPLSAIVFHPNPSAGMEVDRLFLDI